MSLNWDFSTVCQCIADVLAGYEAQLRLEQAVYGLDVKPELEIQKIIADGLIRYFSVAREVHYPSSAGNRLSHRKRCDLVLTPPDKPLRRDSTPPTLFDPPEQATPEEALWLEVKCAYQFKEGGYRHAGYGQQWSTSIVKDLRKMEAEPLIHEAGLCLIVFNQSREVLDKDLENFETILAIKEVLAGFRKVQSFDITERIGHQLCTIALWPTIQR